MQWQNMTQFKTHADFGEMERKESSKTNPEPKYPFQTCSQTSISQGNFGPPWDQKNTDISAEKMCSNGSSSNSTPNLQDIINMQLFALLDIFMQKVTHTQKQTESMKELLRKIVGMVYTGIIPGLQLLESQMQKMQARQQDPKGPVLPTKSGNAPEKKFGNAPEKKFGNAPEKKYEKVPEKKF